MPTDEEINTALFTAAFEMKAIELEAGGDPSAIVNNELDQFVIKWSDFMGEDCSAAVCLGNYHIITRGADMCQCGKIKAHD